MHRESFVIVSINIVNKAKKKQIHSFHILTKSESYISSDCYAVDRIIH